MGFAAYNLIAVHGVASGGTGQHWEDMTTPEAKMALRDWYLCEILYCPVCALVRTSVSVLLLKITCTRAYRWIIFVNLAIVWTLTMALFFVLTAQCSPPSYFWNQVDGAVGKCLDPNLVCEVTIIYSIVGAISDFVLAILPVFLLWNIQMPRAIKVVTAVLLGMGFLSVIPYPTRLSSLSFDAC